MTAVAFDALLVVTEHGPTDLRTQATITRANEEVLVGVPTAHRRVRAGSHVDGMLDDQRLLIAVAQAIRSAVKADA